MRSATVIGAGSWGTTMATLVGRRVPIVLWARRPELAEALARERVNREYLPGHVLPDTVRVTASLDEALNGSELVLMAVPSHGFRQVIQDMRRYLGPDVAVLSLTKGIEEASLATMTAVVGEECPDHDPARTGVMTGPNLASEVAEGQPAAAVVAMTDPETATEAQRVLMGPTFRVYTNDDVIGCELGGAVKNVMAIAAGMSDGLGYGDNTRATLITRALAEMTRLGVRYGGRPSTFAGLAGMGDLIATCSSPKSRNHQVGHALALGRTLDEVVGEMKMVAEGIKTTSGVLGLAAKVGVEMPIAEHVSQVLHQGVHPRQAVSSLMTRQAKAEV